MVAKMVADVELIYGNSFELNVIDGVRELIQELKRRHVKLAVVTGTASVTYESLSKIDPLFSWFDVIITGDRIALGKPHPDPYLAAIEKLGIASQYCVVIENAPLGIRSARAANITCIAVRGPSPLELNDLMNSGANVALERFLDLRSYMLWADANITWAEAVAYVRSAA